MAQVDPKKMQALAKQQGQLPTPGKKGGGGGGKGPGGGAQASGGGDEGEHDEEENDEEENDEDEESALSKLGPFADVLRSNAHSLHEVAEKLEDDGTMGAEEPGPSDEMQSLIDGSVEGIPPSIAKGFKQYVKSLSWEDTQAIGSELADEGSVDDGEVFGAWLYWASRAV